MNPPPPLLVLLLAPALAAAGPLIAGHRGTGPDAPGNPYPENSLPAIARAFEEGADLVELDVQLDSAGELVLSHAHEVRLAGGAKPLFQVRRAEVPPVRGPTGILAPLATLDAALDLVLARPGNGKVLDLELKVRDKGRRDLLVDRVAAVLKARGAVDRCFVKSFDLAALRRLQAALPGVESGLPGFEPRPALAHWAGERAAGGPAIAWVQVSGKAFPGGPNPTQVMAEARRLGAKVAVWTLNRPVELRRWAAAGVDMIITDEPDVAARVLGRSGR